MEDFGVRRNGELAEAGKMRRIIKSAGYITIDTDYAKDDARIGG